MPWVTVDARAKAHSIIIIALNLLSYGANVHFVHSHTKPHCRLAQKIPPPFAHRMPYPFARLKYL